MPTSKSKKPAKPRKSISKLARAESGPVPPYGPPIREAIARGNVQEMRKVAASARKFIRDVEAALRTLDKRIKELSSK
jgi:Domain of unknown function (DUF1843)